MYSGQLEGARLVGLTGCARACRVLGEKIQFGWIRPFILFGAAQAALATVTRADIRSIFHICERS